MAITDVQKYNYPPNFIEGTSTMARGQRRIVKTVSGVADGAGDVTDRVICDKSDLIGPDGTEPSALAIMRVEYDIQGFNYITIEFDDGTDETIMQMAGQGFHEWPEGMHYGGAADTGDILITTNGAAANATYTITLWIKLKQ